MCDTMACFTQKGFACFGKNSDRHPQEPQLVEVCDGNRHLQRDALIPILAKYDRQFAILKEVAARHPNRYRALVSRPSWLWGAEMGVNEHGLAIGNEAVFAREKTEADGLLGMDILRLTLHNCTTARQAVDFIAELTQTYGQGGDGAFKGHLSYSNSYLATDRNEGWIIETAGRHWAIRPTGNHASISNSYAIKTDHVSSSAGVKPVDFATAHADPFVAFFTKGAYRQRTSSGKLASGCRSWTSVRDVLVSNRGSTAALDSSMRSICMNAVFPTRSRTTSSLIVEYGPEGMIAWSTSAPLPCYHPFIPWPVGVKAFDRHPTAATDEAYLEERTVMELTERILGASPNDRARIALSARTMEEDFEHLIRPLHEKRDEKALIEACESCRIQALERRNRLAAELKR